MRICQLHRGIDRKSALFRTGHGQGGGNDSSGRLLLMKNLPDPYAVNGAGSNQNHYISIYHGEG